MLVPEWVVKGGITKIKLRPEQDEVFVVFLLLKKVFLLQGKNGKDIGERSF